MYSYPDEYLKFYRSWFFMASCLDDEHRLAFYDGVMAKAFEDADSMPEIIHDGCDIGNFFDVLFKEHMVKKPTGKSNVSSRKKISPSVRFFVLNRDDFTCQYCGRSAPEVRLEVDHVVPVSKGGNNQVNNLVTSCWDCNRGKGNSVISVYEKECE